MATRLLTEFETAVARHYIGNLGANIPSIAKALGVAQPSVSAVLLGLFALNRNACREALKTGVVREPDPPAQPRQRKPPRPPAVTAAELAAIQAAPPSTAPCPGVDDFGQPCASRIPADPEPAAATWPETAIDAGAAGLDQHAPTPAAPALELQPDAPTPVAPAAEHRLADQMAAVALATGDPHILRAAVLADTFNRQMTAIQTAEPASAEDLDTLKAAAIRLGEEVAAAVAEPTTEPEPQLEPAPWDIAARRARYANTAAAEPVTAEHVLEEWGAARCSTCRWIGVDGHPDNELHPLTPVTIRVLAGER